MLARAQATRTLRARRQLERGSGRLPNLLLSSPPLFEMVRPWPRWLAPRPRTLSPPPPQCGPMGGSKLTWDDLPTKRVPLVLGTSLAEAVAVLSRQNDSGSQHVSPARGVPAAPAAPLATPPRLDNPSVTTTEQESWKPRRSLAVANLLN